MSVLDKLQPGESVVYHTSRVSLARDRGGKKQSAVIAAADEAWQAALAGRVDLLQRRRPDGTTEYLARRRRRVDQRPVLPILTAQSERRAAA
jgi:hypothetical protein